jgi:hypothetical protein
VADSSPHRTQVATRYGSLEYWAFSRFADSVRISMWTSCGVSRPQHSHGSRSPSSAAGCAGPSGGPTSQLIDPTDAAYLYKARRASSEREKLPRADGVAEHPHAGTPPGSVSAELPDGEGDPCFVRRHVNQPIPELPWHCSTRSSATQSVLRDAVDQITLATDVRASFGEGLLSPSSRSLMGERANQQSVKRCRVRDKTQREAYDRIISVVLLLNIWP